jgi:CheY-like chemotaxis protein
METVLIVDDDNNIRSLLGMVLARKYRVILATDGREGLEMAERHRPALILMDQQMPRMTGLEVIEQIRSTANNVKIISITALGVEPQFQKAALAAGADLCLPKPLAIPELLKAIERLLLLKQ